jgi:hypothetical protein
VFRFFRGAHQREHLAGEALLASSR